MAGNSAFLSPFQNGAGFDFQVAGHLGCGEPLAFRAVRRSNFGKSLLRSISSPPIAKDVVSIT
jgi:hypothetical protein